MLIRPTNTSCLNSLTGCLLCLSLIACGESDLVELHEQQLNQLRDDPTGTTSGTTSGDTGSSGGTDSATGTDGGTDGGSSSGSTSSGDAGTDTGSDGGSATGGSSESGVDLSQYDLVFSDEFRTPIINPAKWNTALNWGPNVTVYEQQQYYIDLQNDPDFGYNPFNLDGEFLTITAVETPDTLLEAANNQPWLSGVLTTADTFNFTYGYIEASINPKEGKGVWPAFWMLSTEFEDLKPELYIMEYNGSKPSSLFHNYNFEGDDGNLFTAGQWEVRSDDFASGFHKVGVDWSPNRLLFYIDDVPRYQVDGANVSSQDMYLILNLAIGGIWTEPPDETTPRPASVAIDYVRVYQLKGT